MAEAQGSPVAASAIAAFIKDAMMAVGMPDADAAKVAELMVEADLAGADAHGVFRLPQYIRRIKAGGVNPKATIKVEKSAPATAVVDGSFGTGGHLTVPGNGVAFGDLVPTADGGALVVTAGGALPVVVKITSAGKLDPTFGTGGQVKFSQPGISPGATAFTVMPSGPQATAMDLVICTTPPLLAP